jgi:hypothetical protein
VCGLGLDSLCQNQNLRQNERFHDTAGVLNVQGCYPGWTTWWPLVPCTVQRGVLVWCASDRSKQLCDLFMCQRTFLRLACMHMLQSSAAAVQAATMLRQHATCICMRSQCIPTMRLDRRQLERLRGWVEQSMGRLHFFAVCHGVICDP